MTNDAAITLDHTNPAALRIGLKSVEWGVATINGAQFVICPACMAMLPALFSSPSANTPRDVHMDYHIGISNMISNLTKELQRRAS